MILKDLKTLHMKTPLGISDDPYFSWKLSSEEPGTMQRSYQIEVVSESGDTVWDSGTIRSDRDGFVPYEGSPLESRTRYFWTVTVVDNHGKTAEESSWFETAFLHETDWKAEWVESPLPETKRKKGYGNQAPATFFFKRFQVKKAVRKARLYATAHGVYDAYINGSRPDDRKFAPEYSSYEWVLYYQTYNITDLLKVGENSVGMYVGDGWYCGINTQPKWKGYKPVQAALFQLEIEYIDGTKETVCSDGSVLAGRGPVLSSDLFFGETFDATKELDYALPAPGSIPAKIASCGYAALAAQLGEPVRVVKTIPCEKVLHTKNGETVLDFGQVLCGAVRMTVRASKGTVIKLEHSEVLDKEGNYTTNIMLGMADQIVEDTASGKEETFEPRFCFQGFRYVRISGLSEVRAEDFCAAVMTSEKEDLGTFETSDRRIDRLYQNTRWSQSANMLSIPTDCPQREKAGWTGDIQVYATTSLLNEDTTSLLTRWLRSLASEQKSSGAVPMVVPMHGIYYPTFAAFGVLFGNESHIGTSAGWSDAAVLVPWQMYQVTGNTEILRTQYDSMRKWCDYVIRASRSHHSRKTGLPKEKEQYLWNSGYHWGEWLIPSLSKNGYGIETLKAVLQSRKYIAPVFAYYTMSKMAKIAAVTGHTADAAYYEDITEKIKDAFREWIRAQKGSMPIELQGAYVMPLYFDLVPDEYRSRFEGRLVELVEENNCCLDTGFLATPFLFDTLCKIGREDLAFRVFYGEEAPSYFHQLRQGATTIWESWFTYDEEGDPMNVSLNHYAFGCVDDWMFRTFSGIVPTKPGFKEFRIAPKPDRSLTFAKRTYECEHGTIVSSWEKKDGRFSLHVTIPCNTTAVIELPDGTTETVGSGSYDYSCAV